MDNTLLKGLVLVFLCSLSQWTFAQDLTFTAVSGNTSCDNANHCVEIETTGFQQISAFQFAIAYDTTVLTHVSTTPNLTSGTSLPSDAVDGFVKFSWFTFPSASVMDGFSVITICFEPTGAVGSTTISMGPGPGSFPIQAADENFNQFTLNTDFFVNSATFDVTDNENPVINCPTDTTIMGTGTMVINGIAPASFMDNCLIDTVSYTLSGATTGSGGDDASGTAFNPGTTLVEYTIMDDAGNEDNCSFNVILDVPAPTDTTFTLIPEISVDCINGTLEMCMTVLNADNIESLQIPFVWNEMQLDYLSSNVILPPNGIIANGNVANGVAALIWNQIGLTNGLTLNDGDSLFCAQYNITDVLDTAIFDIIDIPLIPIEVVSVESGTAMPIPFAIEDEIIFTQDNTAPTISGCPNDTTITASPGTCGLNYSWTSPTATDDCINAISVDSTHASGDLFSIGATTVTYTFTDLSGNPATCSFIVTVVDDEDPTITCPSDTTVMTAGPVVVNDIDATASDLCGSVSISYDLSGATTASGTGNASGASFETGMTTVTYTAIDSSGNQMTCSFIVTVEPGSLPEIDCPSDTAVFNDMGNCNAVVNDLAPILISNPITIDSIHYELSGATTGSGLFDVSGTTFNVGVTTVSYIATDFSGQTDTCMFTVTVSDNESPIVDCPSLDAFPNEPGQCGRIVNNNLFPTVSDNCGINSITYVFTGATTGSGSNDPTGSFFNVGVTSIDYTITDDAGNPATCSVQVWVNDMDTPTIECPTDTTATIPFGATSGAVNDIDPVSTGDNCPDPVVTYAVTGATTAAGTTTASGQIFNAGMNTVTYYVADTTGNIDSCMFIVNVEIAPAGNLIECPNDTIVNNDLGLCGAIVNDIGPNVLIDNSLIQSITYLIDGATMTTGTMDASGTFFENPISTIKYVIEDINGNKDSCVFTVTVNDTELPTWTGCPDTIPVYVDNMSCRQVATWNTPVPADNCQINVPTNTHMPGDSFDLGFTTVTYSVQDNAMNTGICEFVIWVRDTFPPSFTCPNDTVVAATSDCNAVVSWQVPTPTDNCTIDVFNSTQPSGDMFPVGVSTVTYTVADDSGNTTQCSFTITVNDEADPVITCSDEIVLRADGTVVIDPNGLINSATTAANCLSVEIDFSNPSATDACDGPTTVTLFDGISSGGAFPIGTTLQSFATMDASGNTDTCRVEITVLPLPSVQAEILGQPSCFGEDVTLNVIDPLPGATYSWFGPDNFFGNGSTVTIPNASAINIGTYAVVCGLPGGCTQQGTIFVTIFDNPDITATANTPLCSDGTGDLIFNAEINNGSPSIDSWSWTGPNTFTSDQQNPTIPNAGTNEIGTYTVTATAGNGCVASSTVDVNVGETVTPNINSDCGGVICLGESCLLLGTEFQIISDNYTWTVEPSTGAGLPAVIDQSSIEVTPTEPGIYIFNYSVVLNGCESETATFVLTVEDDPEAVDDEFTINQNETINGLSLIGNDIFNSDLGVDVNILSGASNGVATVVSDGTFSYLPNEGFIGQDNFTYEICNNCSTPICSEATVTVNIDFEGECEIPTVISPNGDLKNELLVIDCLTTGDFPNNSIKVFNIWGDVVFSASPYNNDWDGTYEGEPLPDGSYPFLFDDGTGNDIVKAILTIFR